MKIAIVTGASSGMGRQFAEILDKQGFDEIWTVALEEDMLEEVRNSLTTPARVFAVDLTADGVERIKEALEQERPDVRWLVNASGFGKFGRYDEIPLEATTNMVQLNCVALLALTETVLPYMSEGARIVEFASVAAFQPTPYVNVYAATKAFVYSYARALNVELKPRKIKVCAVCPFWTKTRFFDRANRKDKDVIIKYAVMYRADKVVQKAYKDAAKGKPRSIYGCVARMQVHLVKLLPAGLVMRIWSRQQKFGKRYH